MRRASPFACLSLLAAGCLVLACTSPKPKPSEAAAAPEPKTWGGELTPVVSVKEVMHDLIDPLSDNIFDSVGSEVTAKGVRDWEPRTDEEWAKVRIGAVTMAEASYLLKIPRPIEPAGWENVKRDPENGELPPPEVLALIKKDPVLWQAKIEGLRNVGRELIKVVDAKDTKGLFTAAEDLDEACEGCHIEFWYPGEKELMRKLRERDAAKSKEAAASKSTDAGASKSK